MNNPFHYAFKVKDLNSTRFSLMLFIMKDNVKLNPLQI